MTATVRGRILSTVCLLGSLLLSTRPSVAGELLVGAASVDITPPKPAALCGQLHTRITVSKVGPPAGRKLVERTVEVINTMWESSK